MVNVIIQHKTRTVILIIVVSRFFIYGLNFRNKNPFLSCYLISVLRVIIYKIIILLIRIIEYKITCFNENFTVT